MNVEELLHNYPRLYHMATEGAWPIIQQHGLLSTAGIVTTSGLPQDRQVELLTRRRLRSATIDHPQLGTVVIRDQAPLQESKLTAALTDMTVAQWLEVLNNRVFFWVHPARLHKLLTAQRYRDRVQDVLTIDTRSLVEAYHDSIRLCAINSGATLFPNASPRGSDTFQTIDGYPFAERRRKHPVSEAITELTVIGGVPDLQAHVVEVHRFQGAESLQRLHP